MSIVQQFKYCEFERLLHHIATSNLPNCRPETILLLQKVLLTNYPCQSMDIEYIMDMTNYYIRTVGYKGPKSRFPIAKYLDEICKGELYLTNFINTSPEI